jgi:hypothetical protein
MAAFKNCPRLSNIIIPTSVHRIEAAAFMGCKGLSEVVLPSSVKVIEDGAFEGCQGLTEVQLPDSIEIIRKYTFRECTSLTKVHLPSKLRRIEAGAFSGCSNLTRLDLPDTLQTISCDSFKQTPYQRYNYAALYPFYEKEFSAYKFGDYKQTVISNLSTWIEGDGHDKITESIKRNRHLYAKEWIENPQNHQTFKNLFNILVTKDNCDELLDAAQKASATEIALALMDFKQEQKSKDGVDELFNYDLNDLTTKDYVNTFWRVAIRSGGEYVIEAYLGKEKTATFPTKYGDNLLRRTGSDCHTGKLEELIIPEGFTSLKPFHAPRLKKITIPSTMKRLPVCTFEYCKKLETVTLPDEMIEIKRRAFHCCSNLKTINIPASLKKVDPSAFDFCHSLPEDTLKQFKHYMI